MAEKKMTQRMVVELMLEDTAINTNDVYVEYLKHQLELLNKKSASKSMTQVQKDNIGYKETILTILSNSETAMSITDIQNSDDTIKTLSNQKISALLTLLIKDNKVERVEGKKATFKAI